MKTINYYVLISVVALGLFGCKKSGSDVIDSTANYPKSPASFITGTQLTGTLKGTLKQDMTYYLAGNVTVNAGDTLAVQQGATIIATGNYSIYVKGTLLCLGTDAKQITFTTQDAGKLSDLGVKGHWGGFLIDSLSKYVYVRYTHINYTGGPDASGSAQATFDVEGSQSYHGGAHIILEDNWFFGGIDDGVHLAGDITVSVKRNVLQRLGGPDGETMNIKAGVKGDISYNYIWSGANNGIKLETGKKVFTPQTNMNIYNNTIINSGWRKVGEATQAILIDKYAAANIYNNILVGNHTGINITKQADTLHSKYGNNLIYAIDDSLKTWVYSVGSWGKKQSTDITGSGKTLCASVFKSWDPNVSDALTKQDNNNPSLSSSSPAIGKGLIVAPFSYWVTSSGNWGTADLLNADLGAYPSDGSGNKHLPTLTAAN
ncbi:MAG: hypothetical protein HXX14_11135 [Bacteroidetes bacterium]|nr:hypothetical protein [Bacteroidota bacterium]